VKPLNYQLVETFAELSKTLNLTKTAENLYLTQSAVSYRLKALEDDLGITLIEREKGFKKIKLTSKGEAFKDIAMEFENVNKSVLDFKKSNSVKEISVALVDSINNYFLKDVYKQFLKDDSVKLILKTEHTNEIYNQIINRTVDIGFVPRDIKMKHVVTERIVNEEMIMATRSPKFNKVNYVEATKLDIRKLIFLYWGDLYIDWHLETFGDIDSFKIQVDSSLLSFELMDKDSWMIIPISVADNLQQKFPDINLIPFKQNSPHRAIYMVSHTSPLYSNAEAVKEFKDSIHAHIYHLNL
jgi:DNA-binding transcriptional LysR family regulator